VGSVEALIHRIVIRKLIVMIVLEHLPPIIIVFGVPALGFVSLILMQLVQITMTKTAVALHIT
jgi:hypothetical protein